MIMRHLCMGIITLIITFIPVSSYSIDLPYISFGQRTDKSDKESTDKNKIINPDNKNAQPSIDLTQPLTLKQCISIALSDSHTMKVAKMNLTQENMNIQDAKSNYFPEIGISGSYTFSENIDFGWEKENYNSSLDASYVIWDNGQRKNTLAQAKIRKDAENSRYRRTSQSLIFEIIRAYYSLLEAEKIIAVDEQALEISKQNVERIKVLIEIGSVIDADLATARVQQANNELTLINDLNNLEITRSRLAVTMGMSPDTQINVIDDPDYESYVKTGLFETENISLEDMKSQYMVSRPELIELKANKTILELSANLARLERWPKITAETHYNLMVDDYLRERSAIKNFKNWDVMARVTFPLFDSGRSYRTVQKAELALQKMDENKAELEQNIAFEIRQAYLSFEGAKKSLDISAAQVADAKTSLEVTQGRYELDEATLIELLDVQARYARALSNRVRAFHEYKIARKSLEKAIGILQ